MTFDRHFRLAAYGLIGSGFIALASTGALGLWTTIIFCAVLTFSFFSDTGKIRLRIRPAWLNLLVLAYIPLYVLDFLALSHSFILSTIHFILFVASIKLLTLSTDRDYIYLFAISLAELLAASTLTIDLVFLATLALFLFSAVASLMLFEIRRTHAIQTAQGRIRPVVSAFESRPGTLLDPFPGGSLWLMNLGITALILLITFPIFFLIPRLALGLYRRPTARPQMVSGFSEQVKLGEIGTIKESAAMVMRVKLSSPVAVPAGALKWRGLALDRYDGKSWTRTGTRRRRLFPAENYYKLQDSIQGADLLWQTFYLEAMTTDVIFSAHKALAISSDVGPLQRDLSDNLFTLRRPDQKLRYTAVSDVTAVDPQLIPAPAPTAPDLENRYLQLPNLDHRIRALAVQITGGRSSAYGKTLALEGYLRTRYSYSLELAGTPDNPDPLAMFLFDIGRGHCEYFASAMAVMLRQIGIPSRLVNGFRGGEFNDLAGVWVVRQYDAHSWVEAYLPPYGWIEFDPTPPDPSRSRTRLGRLLLKLAEAIDFWWTEEVINFDFVKQIEMITGFRLQALDTGRSLGQLWRRGWRGFSSGFHGLDFRQWPSRTLETAATAAFLAALAAALVFVCRPRRLRFYFRSIRIALPGNRNRGWSIVACYLEALDALESRGFHRRSDQTPMEFAGSLKPLPFFSPMLDLTRLYYAARFGTQAAPGDLEEARNLLRELRNISRNRRSWAAARAETGG